MELYAENRKFIKGSVQAKQGLLNLGNKAYKLSSQNVKLDK